MAGQASAAVRREQRLPRRLICRPLGEQSVEDCGREVVRRLLRRGRTETDQDGSQTRAAARSRTLRRARRLVGAASVSATIGDVASSLPHPDDRVREVKAAVLPRALPGAQVRDVDRLSGGSEKGVYRVTLDDLSTVVVYRWDRDENYWPTAAPADNQGALGDASGLDLFLACHEELTRAGVGVARLLEAGAVAEGDGGWAVVEDVPAGTLETALTRRLAVADRAVQALAAQVRAMHAVASSRPGKVGAVRAGSGSKVAPQSEVLARAHDDLAEASRRVEAIGRQQPLIADALRKRLSAILPRDRFALIHGELGPDHVLLTHDGRPIIIDIEGAMFFDVEWEHAFLEVRFGRHYRHFHSDHLDSDRLCFYRLSLYLSLVAGPLRLLDGDFPAREAMQRIADVNAARVLTEVGSP